MLPCTVSNFISPITKYLSNTGEIAKDSKIYSSFAVRLIIPRKTLLKSSSNCDNGCELHSLELGFISASQTAVTAWEIPAEGKASASRGDFAPFDCCMGRKGAGKGALGCPVPLRNPSVLSLLRDRGCSLISVTLRRSGQRFLCSALAPSPFEIDGPRSDAGQKPVQGRC